MEPKSVEVKLMGRPRIARDRVRKLFTLRLDQAEALSAAAYAEDLPVNVIVRQAIDQWIARYRYENASEDLGA